MDTQILLSVKNNKCPNCGKKLAGFSGNAPVKCEICGKVGCLRCSNGIGPVRKCPNCGGKAKLKRKI